MQHKILIVDDQPLILGVIKEILSRSAYSVLTAISATEGLRLLAQNQIDVVISDERMPGMQGSEFLAIVRKRFPNTVRIILTGHASLESAIRAINEGEIYRLLTKPVNSRELLQAVKDGLKQMESGRSTEQRISLLHRLERQAPGITQVKRDKDGVIVIEDEKP